MALYKMTEVEKAAFFPSFWDQFGEVTKEKNPYLLRQKLEQFWQEIYESGYEIGYRVGNGEIILSNIKSEEL